MAFADLLALGDRTLRGHLGESVVYTSGVGVAVPVAGIFDAVYQRVDLGQPGVSSVGPAVFVSAADLSSDPDTDAAALVTVRGVTYRIHEVEPSNGAILLHLHRD